MTTYLETALLLIICGLFALGGWEVKSWKDSAAEASALAAQANQLNSDCNTRINLTKETNDELQKSHDDIAAKLAKSKRVLQSKCTSISSGSADNTSSRNQYAGQNARSLDTAWLLDFAAECETYRSEVIGLNQFIQDERK